MREVDSRQKSDLKAMEAAALAFLHAAGVDTRDQELRDTPERVARLWSEQLLNGYAMDPAAILADKVLATSHGIVIIEGLAFHSLCPHHLVPYQGHALVAYAPDQALVGFGRLGELVTCFTHRLVLQEHATDRIARAIHTHLAAKGAACVLVANQKCLGLPHDTHAQNSVTTSTFVGDFENRPDLQTELLARAAGRGPAETGKRAD